MNISNPDTSEAVSTRAHRRRSRAIAAVAVAVIVAAGIAIAVRTIDTGNTAGTMATGVTFTKASAGWDHAVALDANGEIWELLHGRAPRKHDTGAVRFTQVSAGYRFSLALDTTGGVWSWAILDEPALVESVTSLPKFKQVSAGHEYALALDTSDRLWGWGDGYGGRIGEGPCSRYTTSATTCGPNIYELKSVNEVRDQPTKSQSTQTFKVVYAGKYFSIGLGTEDGLRHWGLLPIEPEWGYDIAAQLLPYSYGNFVVQGYNWKAAAVGRNHVVLFQRTGAVRVFGENNNGQLCLGDTKDVEFNVQLMPTGNSVRQVSAGGDNTAVLSESGNLYMCGANDVNQLGTGAGSGTTSLVKVGENFKFVSVGGVFTVAIDTSGNLWGWGNGFGEDDGTIRQITP